MICEEYKLDFTFRITAKSFQGAVYKNIIYHHSFPQKYNLFFHHGLGFILSQENLDSKRLCYHPWTEKYLEFKFANEFCKWKFSFTNISPEKKIRFYEFYKHIHQVL